MRRLATLLAGLSLAGPALAEPPPALIEATEHATAGCVALGGEPAILTGYEQSADLNGDGTDDFVTDQGRLECAGAWSAFCGPSGCPVTVWLSGPDGGHDRFDLGRLLDVAIRDGAPLPALVARYAAVYCGDAIAESCTRTWTFTSNAPEPPPLDTVAVAVPVAAPPAAPEPVTPKPPAVAGWTLRHIPGASPVALGMGPGNIATLAAFCLSDQPFLALTFHDRPAAEAVALRFGFSQGDVEADAAFEETAGGAFVVPLAGSRLAARMAGMDTEVEVRVDGAPQGTLSLAGSTKALRGALADCHGF